jgi:predicted ATP-grasp superfamily ATP-dependent carboligase
VPFCRYEHVDTQYRLPSDLVRQPGNRRDILTVGVTLRPIAEVALKLDYQQFWTDAVAAKNANYDSVNVGLAFMF